MPQTRERGGWRLLAPLLCVLLGPVAANPAAAQTLGSSPVRIIVPYAAGGIVDLMARAVSDKLGENLGLPVVVEARGGANTALGTEAVARAEPDGHTLLMATTALPITPHLQKVNYDAAADFVGVAHMGYAVAVAAVHPSIPANDIKSFIAYAKSKPGEINYLAPGTSSSFTLSAVLLELVNDIKMTPVSYRGVPPGMPDLIAGRLHFGFIPAPLAAEMIVDGRLKGLAITGNARIKKLPQIATMTEQGFGSSQVSSWYAFAVSAKTPKPIVERLNKAFNEVLKDAGVVARVEDIGGTVAAGWTSERTTKLFADEAPRWGEILRRSGIKSN